MRICFLSDPRYLHTRRWARFFAERGLNAEEAVAMAEEAARSRADIFTMDVLAFAYLQAGRLADAERASERALRTGTRDARILWHSAEIAFAGGDAAKAKSLVDRIPVQKTADLAVQAGIDGLRRRFNPSQLQ